MVLPLIVCLVGAAVAEITLAVIWCAVEVVNIEGAAVPYFNVDGIGTTALIIAETDLPSNLPLCYCWVSSSQPPGHIGVTFQLRHT